MKTKIDDILSVGKLRTPAGFKIIEVDPKLKEMLAARASQPSYIQTPMITDLLEKYSRFGNLSFVLETYKKKAKKKR